MVAEITNSPKGGNTDSSELAVRYLEKENEGKHPSDMEFFFTHDRDKVTPSEVIRMLDANRGGIRKDYAKFFNLTIAPSQQELSHFGSDKEKLRGYVRNVMEIYADNFGKGLTSKDIVWYAKIERQRKYKGTDKEVQDGNVKRGTLKPGDQTHVHILIRRKGADKKTHLSPLTNHRSTKEGVVMGGFDRSQFKQRCEEQFDKQFGYNRSVTEHYAYAKAMKSDNQEERLAWKRKEHGLDKSFKIKDQFMGITLKQQEKECLQRGEAVALKGLVTTKGYQVDAIVQLDLETGKFKLSSMKRSRQNEGADLLPNEAAEVKNQFNTELDTLNNILSVDTPNFLFEIGGTVNEGRTVYDYEEEEDEEMKRRRKKEKQKSMFYS
ncbi:DUF5712 family protein [Limibacter armeniacum]|uniref:DUF5712 family protein n=1 Tax=Limibacter armeniacum TaxID=466084 RepID=UPI002FE6210F